MTSIEFKHPLPASAIELLLILVETAEQYQIQTIPCREVQLRGQSTRSSEGRALPPQKDPLGSLQKLGLIERLNKHSVRLRSVAFARARYERKNWLGKWWVKMIHRFEDRLNCLWHLTLFNL